MDTKQKAVSIAVSLIAVGLLVLSGYAHGAVATQQRATPALGTTFHNQSYNSTVDGFRLSYDEWLPAGYNPTQTYSLAVFLHGIGSSTTWVPGGTNIWMKNLNTSTIDGVTERELVQNASSHGYILIVLNTRSGGGFYANTACGGPQEQDVLDAIVHEKALRNIGSVYFLAFSMGSLGAFEIAEQYPGLIAGIATSGTMTDLFEEDWYNTGGKVTKAGPAFELSQDDCGVWPGVANSTVNGILTNLSGRFDLGNLTNVRLWVAAGGMDVVAPDEARLYSYLEANDSLTTLTCATVTQLGEPAQCDLFNGSLRFVFEPKASHDMSQLDPGDIFAYFGGKVSGGKFLAAYPPKSIL